MLFIKMMFQMKLFELFWKIAPLLIVLIVWLFFPSSWKVGSLCILITLLGVRYWYRRRQMFWPRWRKMLFAAVLVLSVAAAFHLFGNVSLGIALIACTFAIVSAGIWLFGTASPVIGDKETESLRRQLLSPRVINDTFYEIGLTKNLDATRKWARRRKGSPMERFFGRDGSSTQVGQELLVSRSVSGRMTVGGTRYEVPKVKSIEEINAGLRASLTKVGSKTSEDYTKVAPNLASKLGLYGVKFKESSADRARGTISLSLLIRDPLNAIVPCDIDPDATIAAGTPWKIGVDEDGAEVLYDLADGAHLMIAGATRSGKSVSAYSLTTHLLLMGDSVRVLMADPNDATVAPFEDLLSWSTNDEHPEKPTEMLQWVRREMTRRQPILRALQKDKFEVDDFTPYNPMLAVIIDEAANYMRHSDTKAAGEFIGELMKVVAQGAKFGIRLVLITQRPDSTILPTSVRAQISARICFRVEDAQTSTMMFPELENPGKLLGLNKGVGCFREVGSELRMFRGVYLADHWEMAQRIRRGLPKIDIYEEPTAADDAPVDLGELVVVKPNVSPDPASGKDMPDEVQVTEDEAVVVPEADTPVDAGAPSAHETDDLIESEQETKEQKKRSILDAMEDYEN